MEQGANGDCGRHTVRDTERHVVRGKERDVNCGAPEEESGPEVTVQNTVERWAWKRRPDITRCGKATTRIRRVASLSEPKADFARTRQTAERRRRLTGREEREKLVVRLRPAW